MVAAFWPALGNGFVWDDGPNVVHNPHLESLDGRLVRWAFGSFRLGHYQPLTWLSLALDRALWGLAPRGYHLTSLLLHAVNGLLFAVVARRLLAFARRQDGPAVIAGSLVAAAAFALHPLRVESVAWVTERRDLLSGAFCLLALLAYLVMAQRDLAGRPRLAWGGTAVALFALSLASKALALGLPLVLATLDVYPLRRWRPDVDPSGEGSHGVRGALRLLAEKVPFLVLSLGFGVAALAAQAETEALVDTARHSWPARLSQATYSAMFYPRAMLAWEWSPLYERPTVLDPSAPRFLLSTVAFLVVTAGLVALRRRFPAGLAAWLAYLALLAPVSGIAQSGIQLVADRYAYLAGLGFALLAGGVVAARWPWGRHPPRRVLAAAAALAVLGAWAVLSHRQTRVWRDDVSLWRHVVAHAPSAMGFNNLGGMALQSGDRAAALALLRRSIEVGPAFGLPWRNLRALLEEGGSDLDRHELRQTLAALDAALPNHADSATAWTTVALMHRALGDRSAALRHLTRAVQVNPGYAPAWRRLAVLQLEAGDHAGCVESFARMTQHEPHNAAAWTGLGLCREQRGEPREAVAAFERALLLDPASATARQRLRALRPARQTPPVEGSG